MINYVRLLVNVTLVLLLGYARHGFSEDAKNLEIKSFISNALTSVKKHSNLLVTTSNILWVENSGSNVTDRMEVSYLTAGEYYRTICKWKEPTLSGMTEWQGSFNGSNTATFTIGRRAGEIIYRKGGEHDEAAPVNPVIAHLAFLSRDGDSCPVCYLRVKDVVSGEPLHSLESFAITNISVVGESNSTFLFPGEALNQLPTSWIIEAGEEDQAYRIKAATRVINGGKIKSRYLFLNYTNLIFDDVHLCFPTLITLEMIDCQKKQLVLTGMTQVISVMLNPTILTNAFDITKDLDSRARMIWNADAEKFDKVTRMSESQNITFVRRRNWIFAAFAILSFAGFWMLWKKTKE